MKKIAAFIMVFCFYLNSHAFDPADIQIHGFISQGYLLSDGNNYYFSKTGDGTIQFNDFGINFVAQATDDLRLGLQLLSHDLGDIGNNEVGIDWAYADYNIHNWLGLRVGKMKQAFGLYNQGRDVDPGRTCILLPNSIYTESYRDSQLAITGVSLYGLLPAGFEYTVQFGQYYADDEGGVAKTLSQALRIDPGDVNLEFAEETLQLQLLWSAPLDGLSIGATLNPNNKYRIETPIATFDAELYTWIFSLEYLYDNFSFAAEYQRRDATTKIGDTVVTDFPSEGYYGMLAWRFSDCFELGSYYSVFYPDKDDRDGETYKQQGRPESRGWCKDLAATARFDFDENWVFKIEGHYIDGMAQIASSDDDTGEGFLFAARATFSF